ncbi:MAG: sulfatase-like hydrolase/transferase, partial [Rhodothermales bacterium]
MLLQAIRFFLMHRVALFLLATFWTSVVLPASAQPTSPDSAVNVVVIFADDLGYGDLSSYGQTAWETPHLDRMAAEGARLTQFYVPVPYCAPSRATLLTGRYPFHHGFTQNPAPDAPPTAGLDTIGLDSAEVTLGEAFQQAGYATSIIGKWHLGHQPAFNPTRHGFDEYYGILYSNDMRPVELIEDTTVVEYPVVQATLTERYTDRALDFIERNQEQPFFLYLAHAMPHKPLAPSPDFYTPETRDDLYADVLRELDHSVGQVLEKIQELGLDRQTLVIFLSDNGPWFGGSTGGLRGMKAQTWEGGLRVPFIARWP